MLCVHAFIYLFILISRTWIYLFIYFGPGACAFMFVFFSLYMQIYGYILPFVNKFNFFVCVCEQLYDFLAMCTILLLLFFDFVCTNLWFLHSTCMNLWFLVLYACIPPTLQPHPFTILHEFRIFGLWEHQGSISDLQRSLPAKRENSSGFGKKKERGKKKKKHQIWQLRAATMGAKIKPSKHSDKFPKCSDFIMLFYNPQFFPISWHFHAGMWSLPIAQMTNLGEK